MKKRELPEWNTYQLAFFAGLISARLAVSYLKECMEHARKKADPDADLSPDEVQRDFLNELLIEISPSVPADQWNGVIEHCRRLFKK